MKRSELKSIVNEVLSESPYDPQRDIKNALDAMDTTISFLYKADEGVEAILSSLELAHDDNHHTRAMEKIGRNIIDSVRAIHTLRGQIAKENGLK